MGYQEQYRTAATSSHRRAVGVLALSNVLGGVGVASGIAVGGLLAQDLGSTSVAGLAQAASVLGAAVAAVPLATMATRVGRRWALTLGYLIALLGAFLIILAAVLSSLILLLVGLGTFGVAQATNLQSRYAATDGASVANRAKSMSIVIWATTVGSVAGPNLTAVGERMGQGLGIPGLAGPYVFSVVSFASAATVLALLLRPVPGAAHEAAPAAGPTVGAGSVGVGPVTVGVSAGAGASPTGEPAPQVSAAPERAVGAIAALRWASRHPVARFAVVLIAVAHATMVMVMVMTPLHMQGNGMSLELVGVVISLHVLGMYAFSPVFGWLADRFGGVRVAMLGLGVLGTAVLLGLAAARSGEDPRLTALALFVLGLGWSASLISASALLAGVASQQVRVPLQGATDAGMNYAGAGAAALAGPVLALGGFQAVNLAAAVLLVPAVVLLVGALRRTDPGVEVAGGPSAAGRGPATGDAPEPVGDPARS